MMDKVRIDLPCHNITVTFGRNKTGATITSTLHRGGYQKAGGGAEEDLEFHAAMDAIESLVLAHACAGVDIQSPAYVDGIETAVDACINNI